MFWRSRRRVAPRQVSAYRLSGHLRGVLRRRILGTQPVDLKTALSGRLRMCGGVPQKFCTGDVEATSGQRCSVVDLAVRCRLPAPAATALAVDAATRATDPVTTAVNPVDSGSVE